MHRRSKNSLFIASKESIRDSFIKIALSSKPADAWHIVYQHFDEGGGKLHPELGDLSSLLQELKSKWNMDLRGKNLVITWMEEKLKECASPFFLYGPKK